MSNDLPEGILQGATPERLAALWARAGIVRGDTLLLHSSTRRWAIALNQAGCADPISLLLDSFLHALGETGTLLLPLFNFDFTTGIGFDIRTTRSQMGALTEAARLHPRARRTAHPIYSFAVIGAQAERFAALRNVSGYAEDGPFGQLKVLGGKIAVLDLPDQHSMTFYHHVEETLGVDYRYFKDFTAPYTDQTGETRARTYKLFVRDLERGVKTDVDPCGEALWAAGLYRGERPCAGAGLRTIEARAMYNFVANIISRGDARGLLYSIEQGETIGQRMQDLARRLWPLPRSITGNGVRETLRVLQETCPALTMHEIPSSMPAFDWVVPDEWNVREAYIIGPDGQRFCDFAENNLHLLGYSTPLNAEMDLSALQAHLHSLPDQPDAIPYVTSYYARRWGFCLTEQARAALKPGRYKVVIDATLAPGALTYGEIILPGASDREVLISTYVCHPSMANNELSGPCVAIHLAAWLAALTSRRYTYRFVIGAETIGSLVYLSRHLDHLKSHVAAGFNLSCVGDDRAYSYLPSRAENTLSDQAALHVLKHVAPDFVRYQWTDRGSDERQYCAPGVDLPIASIMRTKYGAYPEYHTSLDDLQHVVTPAGLQGGYFALKRAIETLEADCRPRMKVLGEPQLGKRGLYPTISTKESAAQTRTMMNLITYCDGARTLLEIAEKIGTPIWVLRPILDQLAAHDLVEIGDVF